MGFWLTLITLHEFSIFGLVLSKLDMWAGPGYLVLTSRNNSTRPEDKYPYSNPGQSILFDFQTGSLNPTRKLNPTENFGFPGEKWR